MVSFRNMTQTTCPLCGKTLQSSIARHQSSGACYRFANRSIIANQQRERRNQTRRNRYRQARHPRASVQPEVSQQDDCTICLGPISDPFSGTNCRHTFCATCLGEVYNRHGPYSRCPLCRASLNLFPESEQELRRVALSTPTHQLPMQPSASPARQTIPDPEFISLSSTSEESDDSDSDWTEE